MQPSTMLLTANDTPFKNICDSGALQCAFHSPTYFPQGFHSPPTNIHLGSITNSIPIQGIGTAIITVQPTTPSLYIFLSLTHSSYQIFH